MSENGRAQDEEHGLRLCVKSNREDWPSFSIDRDMSVYDAEEICLRVANFIRNAQNGIVQNKNVVEQFELHEFEPGTPKICMIWNTETLQIRVSVIGMNAWDATIALENAAQLLKMIVVRPEGINDGRPNES